MIYFIRSAAGPVKIGFTRRDARTRLASLQAYHFSELTLLRTIPGSRGTERWMQGRFADLRIRGEWFHFQSDMLTILPPKPTESARALIACWDNHFELSHDIDVEHSQISGWFVRDHIPPHRISRVIAAAQRRGYLPPEAEAAA